MADADASDRDKAVAASAGASSPRELTVLLGALLQCVKQQRQGLRPEERDLVKDVLKTIEAGGSESAAKEKRKAPNRDNLEALARDRDELLRTHSGEYVAYYEGRRIAICPDRQAVLDEVRRAGCLGIVLVHHIVPKDQEMVLTFSSPRPGPRRRRDTVL